MLLSILVGPENRTSEQLTPTNAQVGMLSEDGPSNHPATGDTYSMLNTLELPPTGVYAALVLAGESASAPSYVNIPALEMSLRCQAASPPTCMSPTADTLGTTTPTYENTVPKVLSIAPPIYANTISAYENVISLQ